MEFVVNSYTLGSQSNPELAMTGDGGFIVSWSGCCSDGSSRNFAQRFDSLGNRLGSQFGIEAIGIGLGTGVAVSADQTIFVAWNHHIETQTMSVADVFGKVFDPEGIPITADFLVHPYTTGAQGSPHVIPTQDGGFSVVWVEGVEGLVQFGVQGFGSTGEKSGGPFFLQRTVSGQREYGGDFTLDAASNFVGTWQRPTFLTGPQQWQSLVVVQRFAQDGSSLGDAILVDPVTARTPVLQQTRPALAAAPSGGFVIAWNQHYTDIITDRAGSQGNPNEQAILARCFDRLGRPLSPAFRVDTLGGEKNDAPSVAVTPSGHIVFTWEHAQTYYGPTDVYARIFHEPLFSASLPEAGFPFWPGAPFVVLGVLATAAMGLKLRAVRRGDPERLKRLR
jgi:hypothetical protein